MRGSIFSFLFLMFLFEHCKLVESKDENQELPNDSLINAVIMRVIDVDSLSNANLGQSKLLYPFIYYMPIWDRKLEFPPPPPPFPKPPLQLQYGISFDDLYLYFNSSNILKQRIADSIFAIQQIDTTKIHYISKKASEMFKKSINDYYWFSIPIFSSDKKTVIISYSEEFYFGYRTILKKNGDKWVKVEHKLTWMR